MFLQPKMKSLYIYSCLSSKFHRFENVKVAANRKKTPTNYYLEQIMACSFYLLPNETALFDSSERSLLTFHQHLLGVKFSADMDRLY